MSRLYQPNAARSAVFMTAPKYRADGSYPERLLGCCCAGGVCFGAYEWSGVSCTGLEDHQKDYPNDLITNTNMCVRTHIWKNLHWDAPRQRLVKYYDGVDDYSDADEIATHNSDFKFGNGRWLEFGGSTSPEGCERPNGEMRDPRDRKCWGYTAAPTRTGYPYVLTGCWDANPINKEAECVDAVGEWEFGDEPLKVCLSEDVLRVTVRGEDSYLSPNTVPGELYGDLRDYFEASGSDPFGVLVTLIAVYSVSKYVVFPPGGGFDRIYLTPASGCSCTVRAFVTLRESAYAKLILNATA